MTSRLTPDARAVIAAVDRLTTQVRRLADARPTPTDAPSTTCDASTLGIANRHLGPCTLRDGHDGPVHRGPEGETWASTVADTPATTSGRPVVGIDPSTEPVMVVGHWFPMNEQLAEEMNERSNLIQQWAADAVMKACADDEEQQRTTRREQLRNLLARLDHGGLLSPGDCTRLRVLVDTEVRDADTARAILADHRVETRALREKLERYGREAKEQRERAEQAQAAIARVRALADQWDNALAPARSQYSGPVRAALDGTGQPEPSTATES